MSRVREVLEDCDLFLVVGTSSVVYPAAGFAPTVQERGKEQGTDERRGGGREDETEGKEWSTKSQRTTKIVSFCQTF